MTVCAEHKICQEKFTDIRLERKYLTFVSLRFLCPIVWQLVFLCLSKEVTVL